MARIDTYPAGTPQPTDRVPYIDDSGAEPALKLAEASTLGGGGGGANPWGLITETGTIHADEFDGSGTVAWTAVTPTVGGGHATWTVGNDVASVLYGGQSASSMAYRLTPHALAVGESVETAVSFLGTRFIAVVGLVIANDNTEGAAGLFGGTYINAEALEHVFCRSGNLNGLAGSVNEFHGQMSFGGQPMRHRLTRISGTLYRYAISPDGVSWTSLGVNDLSWTPTPTHVGLAVSAWGSDTTNYGDLVAAFEYLRVS